MIDERKIDRILKEQNVTCQFKDELLNNGWKITARNCYMKDDISLVFDSICLSLRDDRARFLDIFEIINYEELCVIIERWKNSMQNQNNND